MNQAASATGRPPAGSTATASCCPMFNSPFFMNTFASRATLIPPPPAQQCFLGSQVTPIQPITSIQPPATAQQLNAVTHQSTVSQQSTISAQSEGSQQPQRPQGHSNQSTTTSNNININNNSNNNYNAPINGPTLSLQHLLANHHPTDCMALAAALASFPHFQQLQQQQSQQNHHQTSTTTASSNATTNSTSVTTNSSLPQPNLNAAAATTNQVPSLIFNSYSTAPQNLNLPAPQAPPVAAHLNHISTSQQQQQSNLPNLIQTSVDASIQNRPLATNTTINNVENQQQPINTAYRRAPVGQVGRPEQQQQSTVPAPLSAQHIAQVTRATLNDDAFNTLLNEQFQATVLLNQILANNQFATSLGPLPMPQQQHVSSPQQLAGTQPSPPRPQFSVPNQVPLAIPSAQQVPGSYVPQARLDQVSSQQHQQAQPQFQQSSAQTATRPPQVPVPSDNIPSSIGGIYQPTQHAAPTPVGQQQQPQTQSEQNVRAQQIQGPHPPVSTHQTPSQQQTSQQPTIPSVSFYPSVPQMEQALALLTNPQVANSIFNQIFSSIYFQNGLRSEQHPHHNPSHHFHHHLHGPHHHHHHHHGANGQSNGQDASLPVDSLAISESKPKGLNRAEIDSLTHYIHTDEKDSRTCVICLSQFELKSKIRPLSCNHAFHAKCVDKWLRANRTCPICRRDALKTYEGKIKRI